MLFDLAVNMCLIHIVQESGITWNMWGCCVCESDKRTSELEKFGTVTLETLKLQKQNIPITQGITL